MLAWPVALYIPERKSQPTQLLKATLSPPLAHDWLERWGLGSEPTVQNFAALSSALTVKNGKKQRLVRQHSIAVLWSCLVP